MDKHRRIDDKDMSRQYFHVHLPTFLRRRHDNILIVCYLFISSGPNDINQLDRQTAGRNRAGARKS